jgi:competence protein ComEA
MTSRLQERIEELAARAGLSAVPTPVVGVAAAVVVAAVVWALWGALRGGGGADVPAPVSAPAAESGTGESQTGAARETTRTQELVVHVAGAVRHPGVYRLADGSRVEDALCAAGGALGSAAADSLNLARVVTDGERLAVPTKEEAAQGGGAAVAGATGGGGAVSAGAAQGPLDINTATAEQLDALPGVGPSTAAKIVAEREKNGPFKSVEDLSRVPGIGPKKVDALKDLVRAG